VVNGDVVKIFLIRAVEDKAEVAVAGGGIVVAFDIEGGLEAIDIDPF